MASLNPNQKLLGDNYRHLIKDRADQNDFQNNRFF